MTYFLEMKAFFSRRLKTKELSVLFLKEKDQKNFHKKFF